MVYPATTHDEARQLDIQNANQFHQILQGDIDTEIDTYEGLGKIPSVAKAMFEAAAYRLPLDWEEGVDEVDLLQPRLYEGNIYVPVFVPAPMLATPDNANWRLYRPVTGVVQMVERHLGSELSGNSLILDNQYVPGNNNIQVFVNRSLWFPGEDFTEVSATRIDFINVPGPDDEIIIYVGQMTTTQYDPSFTGSTLRSWVFQGDGGNQYSILGADSDIAEAYIVFIDGARLIPDVSYTVDSTTDTITFANSYTPQQQISILGIGQVIVTDGGGGGGTVEDADIKEITGTAYTVTRDDAGKVLWTTSANPVTITFPQNSTENVGNMQGVVVQGGAGAVTVAVEGTDEAIPSLPALNGYGLAFSYFRKEPGRWWFSIPGPYDSGGNNVVAYVPGISALRALTGMQEGQSVQMTGTPRAGFYLWDPSDLSAEVSFDTDESNYIAPGGQDGSQGAWVRIGDRARYFSGKAILPFLDRPERSGVYRIAGVPDTPRATGFVVARIESTGGALYGHAQFFSYGSPPVESIASLENGVWTPWRSIALTSDVSLEAMEDEGLLDIRGGVPVVRDRVITLGKGSYSWWCEPIALVFGEVYQRIGVSCVSSNGWQRTLFADSFDSTRTIRQADYGAEYSPDEHNSPAIIEIEGKIYTFYTGHNDDGNMRMRRSSSLDPITIGPEEIIHTSPSNISYAQVGYMGGKIYVFYRGPNSTWSMLISDDLGDTWTNYPVLEYPGWQVYTFATFPFADGTIRLVVTLNPTQTAPNRLWIANINTNTLRVRAGGADIADLTLGEIAQVPDMTEVFDPDGDRVRLFDVQDHGTSASLQRWLTCVWDPSSTATGEYRYMECDLSTGALTKNVKICDSGAAFGSLYHAGMCFSHVTPGTPGNVNVGPVFSIRRTPGNDGSILEQYNSPDGGDTWNLADTIRETSDSEAKMWRPRVPVDTRNRYRARQIDLVWNEGVYNSFEDFDSVIKGRLRFVDPA